MKQPKIALTPFFFIGKLNISANKNETLLFGYVTDLAIFTTDLLISIATTDFAELLTFAVQYPMPQAISITERFFNSPVKKSEILDNSTCLSGFL